LAGWPRNCLILKYVFLSTMYKPALGPIYSPMHWVPVIKQPLALHYIVNVKHGWSCAFASPCDFMACTGTNLHYIYMGLRKNSGNLTIKKVSYRNSISIVSFKVAPLGMYTAIPACFPWFNASLEVLKCECVHNLLHFCVDILSRVKTMLFQP
jgi:hypothetical protein